MTNADDSWKGKNHHDFIIIGARKGSEQMVQNRHLCRTMLVFPNDSTLMIILNLWSSGQHILVRYKLSQGVTCYEEECDMDFPSSSLFWVTDFTFIDRHPSIVKCHFRNPAECRAWLIPVEAPDGSHGECDCGVLGQQVCFCQLPLPSLPLAYSLLAEISSKMSPSLQRFPREPTLTW